MNPRRAGLLLIALTAIHLGGPARASVAIPRPDLSQTESSVREQLVAEREAVDRLMAAPDGDPLKLASAVGRLGQLYLLYELFEPARACFESARAWTGDGHPWAYLGGIVHQASGELEEARAAFAHTLSERPTDLAALIRLARVEFAAGELEEAERRFGQARDQDQNSAAALYGLGQIAALDGDHERAAELFERVLELQPQASTAQYQLGLAYRELGRMDEARERLALRGRSEVTFPDPLLRAVVPQARGAGVLVQRATRARAAGQLDMAAEALRQALAIDPDDSVVRLSLASLLIEQGHMDEAISELEQVVARDPTGPSGHYNLGTALSRRGETELALEHLRRAAELAPDFESAQVNLAGLLGELGRFEEAERHYARAIELNPRDASTRFQRAEALRRLGRIDEAILELEAALKRQSDFTESHLALGRLLGQAGRFSEAADSFGRVLELNPDQTEAQFARGLALLLAERYPEALDHFEGAVANAPNDLALKHSLARLLATCPDDSVRDGARALGLAQEVFRTRPSPDYVETLAMAYAETGDFESAILWQRRRVDHARQTGEAGLPGLTAVLEGYERGLPARAPWLASVR